MSTIATKLQVGIAGCAVAAAASLTSVAPAEAAPVPAPATPAVFGDAPLQPLLGGSSPLDLLGGRAPSGLLQNTTGGTPFIFVNQILDTESALIQNTMGGAPFNSPPFNLLSQILNLKINIIRGIIQFVTYGLHPGGCGCAGGSA